MSCQYIFFSFPENGLVSLLFAIVVSSFTLRNTNIYTNSSKDSLAVSTLMLNGVFAMKTADVQQEKNSSQLNQPCNQIVIPFL